MRTVYGIQFQVHPNNGQTPADCIVELRDLAARWVSQKYMRVWNKTVDPPFDGLVLEPAAGHWLRTSHQCYEDCELVSMEWGHPDDHDDSIVWVTACIFARQSSAVYAAVFIRISSTRFVVRPTRYALGRPSIVWDALTHFNCTIGGEPIPVGVREVRTTDVANFTQSVLLSCDRALPVVLVSPDTWTEQPVVNPAALHNKLAGFAHVVKLVDKWGAFKLTDQVGRELSCFNGAVRVYWPGLKLNDYPFQHPLYLAQSIKYYRERGRELKTHLFRMFAGMSAFRAGELGPIRAIQRGIESQRDSQLKRLREQMRTGTAENSELMTELEKSLVDIEVVMKERDQLSDTVERLKGELEIQRTNWATYQQYMDQEDEEEIAPDSAAQAVRFGSVHEAYIKAQTDFCGPLIFLESAQKSAQESPFKQPQRVYEAFEALYVVAGEWQDKLRKGQGLGRSFKDLMQDLGFDVHRVSPTSKGKWGDDYKFVYKGDRVLFEDHITLGSGQPDMCLSIHWYRDNDDQVVVIGHCGIHGTNTST